MANATNLVVGIIILLAGLPLGNYLAKFTKDESKQGQKWFKLIIIFSVIGALIGLFLRDDVLFFSLAFIAVVTSRSLKQA